MRPTALVDCDGVLADFVQAALDALHALTSRRYQPTQITSWELFDSLPAEEKMHQHSVYSRLKGRGGCAGIPVYPGAKEGIESLREVADVVIVTSPFYGSDTWVSERTRWLKDNFGINPDDIIHTKNKERIHGNIFVDDKPEHVEAWLKYWQHQEYYDVLGLLWGADRTTAAHPHLTRVSDWPTLRQLAVGLV